MTEYYTQCELEGHLIDGGVCYRCHSIIKKINLRISSNSTRKEYGNPSFIFGSNMLTDKTNVIWVK